jgi:hypothetical protein
MTVNKPLDCQTFECSGFQVLADKLLKQTFFSNAKIYLRLLTLKCAKSFGERTAGGGTEISAKI